LGYKRWAIRLPEDYVTVGTRARKVFNAKFYLQNDRIYKRAYKLNELCW
ncbi:hypothetical protein NECAME_18933, partial [Necator americanus]